MAQAPTEHGRADDGMPLWLRLPLAMAILLLLLWASWGFRERLQAYGPVDLEKGSYPLAAEKGPPPDAVEATRLRARELFAP
ncbi:hypothetical protein HRbin39_00754 [bacterium HR39]|nr:hypothetical protein HRbin39_00754 [bacterium HR39]